MPATTPQEVDHSFAEAMRNGDMEALLALYEPEATLIAGPDEAPVIGREGIRGALNAFASLQPELVMQPEVILQSGDLAVVYNDWTGTGKDPQGSEIPLAGRAVEVLHRQPDGTWKYLFDDGFARG